MLSINLLLYIPCGWWHHWEFVQAHEEHTIAYYATTEQVSVSESGSDDESDNQIAAVPDHSQIHQVLISTKDT
ncbi:hypothetical protein D5086_030370 [Populus alba]|uniref:Uncharacterized protein n=1 Tax=Populus alba TaxID=43335 RepID=A0ACC4ANA3_POPAL